MKTSTINMFAATSEDLPIFSGVGLTELTVDPLAEWTDDGMDGYCNGCALQITLTTSGSYRTEVRKNDYLLGKAVEPSIASAQKFAIYIAKTRSDRA